jgi:NhaP-type Na+/H+ or K+/H+ antiporter
MHPIVDVTIVAGIGEVVLAGGVLEELEDRAVPHPPSTTGLIVVFVFIALSLAVRGFSGHLLALPRHSSVNGGDW